MTDSVALLYQKLMYPLLDLRRGTRSLARLAELNKSQWLKPEEMHSLQNRKLRVMIEHAYNNVPFYHRTMDSLGLKPGDIKTTEDLKKLPVMDKTTVREHFEELKAKNFQSH